MRDINTWLMVRFHKGDVTFKFVHITRSFHAVRIPLTNRNRSINNFEKEKERIINERNTCENRYCIATITTKWKNPLDLED